MNVDGYPRILEPILRVWRLELDQMKIKRTKVYADINNSFVIPVARVLRQCL